MLFTLHMLIGAGKPEEHKEKAASHDPRQMALYPLAVTYLLSPAGIAVLVTDSAQLDSVLTIAIVAGLVLLMGALDMAVFKNLDKLAKQLVLDGLDDSGISFGLQGH